MDNKTYNKLIALTNKAEVYFDGGMYHKALQKYNEAFLLIPKPYSKYEASSWVLTGLGDCHYFLRDYKESLNFFKHAEACEGGLNPFIWMRIGQCHFELEDRRESREYLIRAYAMEGKDIFEMDNPKYLESIKDLISSN